MNQEGLKYLIALSQCFIGYKKIFSLLKHFGNCQNIYLAPAAALHQHGLTENNIKALTIFRQENNLNKLLLILQKEQINVITIFDNNYPHLLKNIAYPPLILYFRGNKALMHKHCLAVVGTRQATDYGKAAVDYLIKQCLQYDLTIVSGLALGIDTLAHKIALENKGKTIAVLPAGLDKKSLNPKANLSLCDQILNNNGLLLSEHFPYTPCFKQNFVLRNRIVSGLCLGTLVIEAGKTSGSLITARFSLEQNREVFAVPGSIFSLQSEGCHQLIKQGAVTTTKIEDILENLQIKLTPLKNRSSLLCEQKPDSKESLILTLCLSAPKNINDLSKKSRLNMQELTTVLTALELKGKIKNVGGGNYLTYER